MVATKITFYWGSGCPYCMRAMMALEEKGLDYESRMIPMSSSRSEEMLKLNPRGQVGY